VAPISLQGILETAPFMEGITYNTKPDGTQLFMRPSDLEDRRGGYARTPEEVEVRRFGVRSQKEVSQEMLLTLCSRVRLPLTRSLES